MPKHECGCVTKWDDDANHPVYVTACFTHRPFAKNWLVEPKPREPVKAQ